MGTHLEWKWELITTTDKVIQVEWKPSVEQPDEEYTTTPDAEGVHELRFRFCKPPLQYKEKAPWVDFLLKVKRKHEQEWRTLLKTRVIAHKPRPENFPQTNVRTVDHFC
jgi:hypothetical protein